jgi:hypothetical protein
MVPHVGTGALTDDDLTWTVLTSDASPAASRPLRWVLAGMGDL